MGRPVKALNGLPDGGLPPKQERVALALAAGSTLSAAAKAAGVGETTVKRWLKEPAVVKRVADLRTGMTDRAVGLMTDGFALAAATLRALCAKGKSEQVRLGAARALVELGGRMREAAQPEERVAALENGQRGATR